MNKRRFEALKVVVLLSVTLLAACDGVRRVPMTEQGRASVERIALTRVEAPEQVVVTTTNPAGAAFFAFGAIGGLVAGSLDSAASESATTRVMESLNGRHRMLGEHLTEALKASLTEGGYDVREIAVRRKAPRTLLEDLRDVSFEGDALLDVVIRETRYSGAYGGKFRPHVSTQVRLLERSSGRVLYADEIYYADISGYADSPAIKPAEDSTFASLSALEGNPDRTLSSLQSGLEQVAKRVGERMSRRSHGAAASASTVSR